LVSLIAAVAMVGAFGATSSPQPGATSERERSDCD
jgi:hypothetical protein